MEKAELKKEIRERNIFLRDSMNETDVLLKSDRICENIFAMKEWKESDIVYTYISMKNEPDTGKIIKQAYKEGKRICAPKIFGREMKFIEFQSEAELRPGKWGITEPVDKGFYEDKPGIVIVPGIAFGKNFSRVGFGAGYYDRYFSGHNEKDGFFLVAVGYDFQLCEEVPCEEFDVYMDAIVTDETILYK